SRQSLMFSPKKEKWIKWPFRTRPLAAFIGRHNLRGPGPPRHAHIPTTDFIAPAILGSPGVCPAAALRHGSRGRHLAHRHVPARHRPGTLARGLRPTLAPPQGRALRREPQPAAALLPVPG